MQQSAPPPIKRPNSQESSATTLSLSSSINFIKQLWYSSRLARIGLSLVAIIVFLSVALIIVTIVDSIMTNVLAPKSDAVEATDDISTTKNKDDDAFFAQQSNTIVYYSFAQTTNSKNIVQATPTYKENRIIEIGYPDRYKFLTSPDGKWLVRWNETQLDRSSAANPTKFTSLHTAKEPRRITSVVWQSDSTALALSTIETSVADIKTTTISLIPQLTMDVTEVYSTTTTPSIELVAFPSATSLYLQENNNGIKTNLSMINPRTGTVERDIDYFNENNALANTRFDRQMHNGYTSTGTKITKTTLESGTEAVVHELNTQCNMDSDINTSQITGFSVAPSGDYVLFTEQLDYCYEQLSEAKFSGVELPKSRFTLYSLKESKPIHQVDNPKVDEISNTLWSVDENYVWISHTSENAYIFNASDASLTPIPNLDRKSLLKERVFPIGWLQPSK